MLSRKFAFVLALALAALPGFAPTAATAQAASNSQQQKMKDCNKQAADKQLKGDDRKTFMSTCLSSAGVSMTQQEKMKECNKEASAKSLKGDERKSFMSTCLSGSAK